MLPMVMDSAGCLLTVSLIEKGECCHREMLMWRNLCKEDLETNFVYKASFVVIINYESSQKLVSEKDLTQGTFLS